MQRSFYLDLIQRHFRVQPICAILGPRQVGKTTLARQFAATYPGAVEFFDLENPIHLASLDTPLLTLAKYADRLVVIDEIQRRPELFPILRVLVDDPVHQYRFLILGSASRTLIQQSSETLAGRIGYIELPPFTLAELLAANVSQVADAATTPTSALHTPTAATGAVPVQSVTNSLAPLPALSPSDLSNRLLIRGGFPRSYLATDESDSFLWRTGYINTFLERDIPNLGFDIPANQLRRFWLMLCFYHGQSFNAQEIAQALMLSDKTVTKYLDILAGTFMIRVLAPWFENLKKRQVKRPKIYFRDTGILNNLTTIHSLTELAKTPKIGAVWEGFALEQIIQQLQVAANECFFWGTANEAELDLLIFKNGQRLGFEIKYTDSPKVTKSMQIALQDLQLDHLYLIFPGDRSFPLGAKITACGLESLSEIK